MRPVAAPVEASKWQGEREIGLGEERAEREANGRSSQLSSRVSGSGCAKCREGVDAIMWSEVSRGIGGMDPSFCRVFAEEENVRRLRRRRGEAKE